jgi:hypothetical protein
VFRDIRFAIRSATRNPALTAVIVISLALGIGANTTIFTLINAVFLRPLPVHDPARLAQAFTVMPTDGWTFAAVSTLLAAVGMTASFLPARRATSGSVSGVTRDC